MVDKKVVAVAVKERLQALYGDRLAKVILFGSYARGEQRPESDIDFLVVLTDEALSKGSEIVKLSTALSPLNLVYDVVITKHPATLSEYQKSPFLFYQNIRKEGVEI